MYTYPALEVGLLRKVRVGEKRARARPLHTPHSILLSKAAAAAVYQQMKK